MIAVLKSSMHGLTAAFLLLILALFIQTNAVAQTTRATIAPPAENTRPPPPDPDDLYNSALFSSQSVPTTMTAGAVYTVTVVMINNGNTTWTNAGSYALGSRNPYDNVIWGGGRVGLAGSVSPGRTATFTFNITAPLTAGSYNFQWAMLQEGIEWFGPPSDNVVVNVVAPRQNNAQFIGQSVPPTMTAGGQYTTTVTFSNTGNTTWDPANGKYSIAAVNPVNNPSWGYNRAGLGSPVAPGEQRTVTINVTAPSTPGTYNYQWMVIEEGVELFGTPSNNVAVAVNAAPVNGAAAISMNVPPLTQGQNATMSVTMQNTGNTTWPAGSNYKLGSKNPDENSTWGVPRVDLASDVAPGQQYTFTFPITAPAAGTYTMQWEMMERYVEWFGQLASGSVTVSPPPPPPPAPHNDAQFVAQSVPANMTTGSSNPVTITMANTGNTTWIAGAQFSLGSSNPSDNRTWGTDRVALAGNVAPGQSTSFTFQAVAPNVPGNYPFQWRMKQDGVEWFGAPSQIVTVQVNAPLTNGAAFVSQSVPTSMSPGQTYNVSLTMQNTGTTTWTVGENYRLGSSNPLGNGTWSTTRVALPSAIAPGQTATFNFQVVAPSTTGSYVFEWHMLREGVEWFGAPSQAVSVQVSTPLANGAAFVAQSVVATMVPGQTYNVSVTMQNSGTTTWTAGESYRLGSSNPLGNGTWTTTRVELPSAVAPGQTATFSFPVVAPATPGLYAFEWRMLREGVEWFGPPSQTVSIQVAALADTVTYIHTDGLGSPVARSDSAGNVVSRTAYEPYGRTASGNTPSIGFTGHVNDADTGLVYMQQRYYDPVAGRFLSIDPVTSDIHTGANFNRYSYTYNNPYKYTDPDGRIGVAGFFVGAGIDVSVQVAVNMAHGQSFGGALSNVSVGQVLVSGALGAIGQIGGATAARSIVSGLSNQAKGVFGEGVARVGIALRGETVIASQARAGTVAELGNITGRAANAVPDFVVRSLNGAVKVVEAKFNSSGLTGAQRALQAQMGPAFTVSRTTISEVAGVAGHGSAAAAGAVSSTAGQKIKAISE